TFSTKQKERHTHQSTDFKDKYHPSHEGTAHRDSISQTNTLCDNTNASVSNQHQRSNSKQLKQVILNQF
ncbi:hypothetical protein, partial [Klebsiella pneumoniae]|uniref:hypothetical protein n=1 Tax=Klebsiella pneumoniae TaxID=573 RepID=UPI002731C6E0